MRFVRVMLRILLIYAQVMISSTKMVYRDGEVLDTIIRATGRALEYVKPSFFPQGRLMIPAQSVMIFLVIVTNGLHYVVQRMNYTSDVARIERITSEAKLAAWGPKMIPVEGPRKVFTQISEHSFVADQEACSGEGQHWWTPLLRRRRQCCYRSEH